MLKRLWKFLGTRDRPFTLVEMIAIVSVAFVLVFFATEWRDPLGAPTYWFTVLFPLGLLLGVVIWFTRKLRDL